MRVVDLIAKKRQGEAMTAEELTYLIRGYTAGEIPDYQMSAWLMAVVFQGMTKAETADLTMAMAHSGEMLDLSFVGPGGGRQALHRRRGRQDDAGGGAPGGQRRPARGQDVGPGFGLQRRHAGQAGIDPGLQSGPDRRAVYASN